MPFIDKLHIVEIVGGFQKISGGNAWNGGTRTNTPIAISKEGQISIQVTSLSQKFAIGLSRTYTQGNYTNMDFCFVLNTTLTSIAKGSSQSHAIALNDTLTIKKYKVGNEFVIQFFNNTTLLREYNTGYNWETYYGELAMFEQGQSISVISFTETSIAPPQIITPIKTYTFFQDNIFNSLFPQYMKEQDSYKDVNNKGFLQRYMEVFGKYIDEFIDKYIAEINDRVVSFKSVEDYLIPYWENQLGINLNVSDNINIRRKILENFFTLSKVKGSKRGYTLAMKLLLFDNFLIQSVNVLPDYQNPIPTVGCNACIPYDIQLQGTLLILNAEIVNAIFKVAKYNEPINWKLDDVVYNENILTQDYIQFFFNDDKPFILESANKDPNLYLNNSLNPTFNAYFNATSNLILEGSNESNYEFDDTYFGNEGKVIYREPSTGSYTYFNANTPTNITTSSFVANWTAKPNAIKYYLNIGKARANNNEIINERVVDNLVLPNSTTSQVAIDLENDTVYYYQVIAENAQGQKALSSIQSLITLKTISAPVALDPNAQGSYFFIASWQRVVGATAYELDVATNNTFTVGLETFQLRNINQFMIYRNAGTYYYRVRAKVDKYYRDIFYPKPVSISENSNVITVIITNTANAWNSGFSNGFGI